MTRPHSAAVTGEPFKTRAGVCAQSRRAFLRTLTVAGLSVPWVWPAGLRAAPNSKLNHACIGVGGMGAVDLQNFKSHPKVQIVALCDVDRNALQAAAKLVPDARLYTDWRQLLSSESDRIDSVNVTVPDHMHFAIAYSAIERGKHVYCQKPMCHDVAEVRVLAQAAAKRRVVTQLGTQGASTAGERTAVQLLASGVIGKIQHAYLCSNRPGAIEAYRLPGPRPPRGQPPPPHLNWDLWIGTAPMRPFVPDIYHPVKWRAWQDFGTGWSGDIGCHIFHVMWKGLGLTAPRSVRARVQESWKNSPARRADTWPQSDHITWIFPGNNLIEGRFLTVEWFDGEFYPPQHIRALYTEAEYPPESAMLVGTQGAMLTAHGRSPVLLPADKFRNFKIDMLPGRNHYHDFADACLDGHKTESPFDLAGPMTEAVLLGTVAIRLPDEELEWDAAQLKFTNSPQATALLRRTYREGWHLAGF
jgi:predicted dehydrogenase